MLPRKRVGTGAGTGAGKRTKEMKAPPIPLVLNGWRFLAWPAFDERWVALLRAVAAQRKASAQSASRQNDNHRDIPASPEAILLAALVAVLRDRIARDPNAPNYRLRDNLGAWRRVKFLGRLRLFYRFSSAEHIVVLTWLNDEHTLRKEGASTDPYVVFSGMLSRGDVPADWEALVAGAKRMSAPLPDVKR